LGGGDDRNKERNRHSRAAAAAAREQSRRMVFGRNKPAPSTASPSSAAAAACGELRAAYHECFNRWYAEKFAKGQWQKDDCAGQWNKYRACLEVNLEPPPPPPNPLGIRLDHRALSLLALRFKSDLWFALLCAVEIHPIIDRLVC
jgi:hypothetical protein